MGLSVKPMPLSELVAAMWDGNPKKHALSLLDASMRDSGFIDTPILDERTGLLLGGHGRTKHLAALKESESDPPLHVTVRKDGEWMVPVQRGARSRDDNHAARMALVLNRATERGGWDEDKLGPLLSRLSESEAGLDATGYDDVELRMILARLQSEPSGASDEGNEEDGDGEEFQRVGNGESDLVTCPHCQRQFDLPRE